MGVYVCMRIFYVIFYPTLATKIIHTCAQPILDDTLNHSDVLTLRQKTDLTHGGVVRRGPTLWQRNRHILHFSHEISREEPITETCKSYPITLVLYSQKEMSMPYCEATIVIPEADGQTQTYIYKTYIKLINKNIE